MAILIDNQQAKHPIAIKEIQRRAQAILNALGCPDDELSVVIVDDRRIALLNEQHLDHQGPTNVISFSMREGEYGDLNPQLIGDVVISMETCAREAQRAAMPTVQRFYQLLVHGMLHLFGYDHTKSSTRAQEMDQKSAELMDLLNSMEN